MKVTVTVKSEGATRPSEHKLSPLFSGGKGFDHKETFTCAHSFEHALLFCKLLDLSAMQCGITTGEFKPDLSSFSSTYFISEVNAIITRIETLHEYLTKGQKTLEQRL